MVNKEHYARLLKGVQAWNEWRTNNLTINPDLSGLDFSGAYLNGVHLGRADLKGTNLSKANLSRAYLKGTNLSGANLSESNLSGANLSEANLSEADFKGANLTKADLGRTKRAWTNLSGANLSESNLSEADFSGANLTRANLSGADLTRTKLSEADFKGANLTRAKLNEADFQGFFFKGANFNGANLNGANLSGLKLKGANFNGANLNGANLSGLDLSEADLSEADLSGANLNGANLSGLDLSGLKLTGANLNGANLRKTQALGTDFTDAKFTGACLEDWNINSATKLDNINCQYVYLKSDFQERRPSCGEFAPGEFTKLFQKALETVDLIFTDGIDWKAFLLSFQELQAEYGEENLSVQAIEKKSGGAFVIRLEVPLEVNKADIERQAKALYEIQLKALEARYHAELQAKDEQIVIYRQQNATLENVINILGNRPIQNIITVSAQALSESMSESYQSKYDQRNSNNQFVDTAQSGSNPTFNQYNYTPEQKQNLVEAAKEIEALLQHLQQSYPTTTTSEKMSVVAKAVDEIERNPTLKARVIGALKAGGTEALKELVDNPLINILLASIEGWQEAE